MSRHRAATPGAARWTPRVLVAVLALGAGVVLAQATASDPAPAPAPAPASSLTDAPLCVDASSSYGGRTWWSCAPAPPPPVLPATNPFDPEETP